MAHRRPAERMIFSMCAAAVVIASVRGADARIEIILMGQARGLRPPPLEGDIRFKGTPFGHMALYIESATRDPEAVVRQAREGESAGLVLTVDKQLASSFFTAVPRDEFFYGPLDPARLPSSVTREDIENALSAFNAAYGKLYNSGRGESGFGQDYGISFVRKAWGIVYPTTRAEEARIIDYWRRHRRATFRRATNNCVSIINRSLYFAGLTDRRRFFRAYACYNSWIYWVRHFVTAGSDERVPDGNYLRRDGTCLAIYPQLPSDAMLPSRRPFNAWSLLNMGYFVWLSPRCTPPIEGMRPVDYAAYPSAGEPAASRLRRPLVTRQIAWYSSQIYEFLRLWPQTIGGIWWGITK